MSKQPDGYTAGAQTKRSIPILIKSLYTALHLATSVMSEWLYLAVLNEEFLFPFFFLFCSSNFSSKRKMISYHVMSRSLKMISAYIHVYWVGWHLRITLHFTDGTQFFVNLKGKTFKMREQKSNTYFYRLAAQTLFRNRLFI